MYDCCRAEQTGVAAERDRQTGQDGPDVIAGP